MSVWGAPLPFWKLGKYRYPYYRYTLDTLCKNHMKQDGIILDAGCGSHITSLSTIPENVTTICVDFSRKNLEESHRLSKEKGLTNLTYLRCSVTDMPFKNEVFNLIVSMDVIEHVPENSKVAKEAYRTCKKGGTFAGSTSNLLNPIFLLDSLIPKFTNKLAQKYAGENHYDRHTRLTPKQLQAILTKSGFKKTVTTLIGYPLFRPVQYQYTKKKLPIYAYTWIIFNKLTKGPLKHLKEAVVFYSIKQ